VVAGAGSNDTRRAIGSAARWRQPARPTCLHVSPAYSKPPQRGIEAHFRAVADATELPGRALQRAGRTASNRRAATTLGSPRCPTSSPVKEASGNLAQVDAIQRDRPDGFAVLSGDDQLTLGMLARRPTG
jgi:4-hydroxy-tetrahydrodipicolinate synthase